MNTLLDIWENRIRHAKASELLVLDRRVLSVFHTDRDLRLEPQKWLAMAERNLVELHRKSIDMGPESLPTRYCDEIRNYLQRTPELLRDVFSGKLPNDGEAMGILYAMENYPALPPGLPSRISSLHGFLQELSILSWDSGIWLSLELVRKQTEWLALIQNDFQLFPLSEAMEVIDRHLSRYKGKTRHHLEDSVQWGREFDGYYQEALSGGKSEKYARTLARRRFLEKHPIPKTDDELLNSSNLPGTSMVSLQKYHRKFLSQQAERSLMQSVGELNPKG